VTNPPPPVIAGFSLAPTNGVVPLMVYFTNLSSGSSSFSWDFGDGNSSLDVNSTNTYTNAGTYSVTLIAVGPAGTNMLTLTNAVVVTNPPPPAIADFSAAPTSGIAPLTVYFTNLSSGASTFSWDFADGTGSTNYEPSNTYTNPGSYTITLTAAGDGGTNAFTRTNYIQVSAPARIVINPSPIDFGFVFTGRVAQAEILISNAGDVTLSATGRISNGPFSYAAFPFGTNLSFDLPALGSTNIVFIFAPLSPNVYSAVVEFTSNGGNSNNTLLGEGVSVPLIRVAKTASLNVILSFDSLPGKDYLIEFKDSLADSAWQPLQTIPGDGSTITITNSSTAAAHRFSRLSVE